MAPLVQPQGVGRKCLMMYCKFGNEKLKPPTPRKMQEITVVCLDGKLDNLDSEKQHHVCSRAPTSVFMFLWKYKYLRLRENKKKRQNHRAMFSGESLNKLHMLK